MVVVGLKGLGYGGNKIKDVGMIFSELFREVHSPSTLVKLSSQTSVHTPSTLVKPSSQTNVHTPSTLVNPSSQTKVHTPSISVKPSSQTSGSTELSSQLNIRNKESGIRKIWSVFKRQKVITHPPITILYNIST